MACSSNAVKHKQQRGGAAPCPGHPLAPQLVRFWAPSKRSCPVWEQTMKPNTPWPHEWDRCSMCNEIPPENAMVPHMNCGGEPSAHAERYGERVGSVWGASPPSRAPAPSPAGFLSLFNWLSLPGSSFLSSDVTPLPRESWPWLGFILKVTKPRGHPQAGLSLHKDTLGTQRWGAKGRSCPHWGPASHQR